MVPDAWQVTALDAASPPTSCTRLVSLRGLALLVVLIATGIGVVSTGLGTSMPVDPVSQFGGASPGTITFFYPASSLPPSRTAASMRRISKLATDWLVLLVAMLLGAAAVRTLALRGCATRTVARGRPRVLDRVPLRRGPPAFV
jgi:hypothetical protein